MDRVSLIPDKYWLLSRGDEMFFACWQLTELSFPFVPEARDVPSSNPKPKPLTTVYVILDSQLLDLNFFQCAHRHGPVLFGRSNATQAAVTFPSMKQAFALYEDLVDSRRWASCCSVRVFLDK